MDCHQHVATLRATTERATHDSATIKSGAVKTISSLPPELFLLCLRFVAFSDRRSALLVCRSWYMLGVSSPEIWTACEASVVTQYDLAFLRTHIALSGGLPLDLKLNPSYPHQEEVLSLVVQHADRLRSLTVSLSVTIDDAPILRDLCVVGHTTLPRAPLLRTAVVTRAYIESTEFCFHHLTSFEGSVRGPYSTEFFQISPNLEQLSLVSIATHGSPTVSYWPRAPHPPRLAELRITDFHSDPSEYLRTYHGCRSLRSIELRGNYGFEDAWQLFENTGHELERLEITGHDMVRMSGAECILILSSTVHRDFLTEIGRPLSTVLSLSITLSASQHEGILQLPALEHLTWITSFSSIKDHNIHYVAPALRVLTVETEQNHNTFAGVIGVVESLPYICNTNIESTRLRELILISPGLKDSHVVDLSSLKQCADRVFHSR